MTLVLSVGLLVLWIFNPFSIQLLGALSLLGWSAIELHLCQQVRTSPADEVTWSLRSSERLTLLGVGLLCTSIVALTAYLTFTRVYTFVEVSERSMFPQILPGDRLLVSKTLLGSGALERGRLIVYRSALKRVRVARIMAINERGQTQAERVGLNQLSVSLNGKELSLKAVTVDIPHFKDAERQVMRGSFFFIEYEDSPKQGWLISRSLDIIEREKKFTGSLGENTLFVVSDVRAPLGDPKASPPAEIISLSQVIGVPIMIVDSTYPHEYAQTRSGLSLR